MGSGESKQPIAPTLPPPTPLPAVERKQLPTLMSEDPVTNISDAGPTHGGSGRGGTGPPGGRTGTGGRGGGSGGSWWWRRGGRTEADTKNLTGEESIEKIIQEETKPTLIDNSTIKKDDTVTTAAATGGGGCPMRWGKKKDPPPEGSKCPISGKTSSTNNTSISSNTDASISTASSKDVARYMHPVQYNVYGQEIDPTNNMPAQAVQDKAPNQKGDLSTERVVSTIPKAGSEGTWVYPSPQMFWNAITRKGKVDESTDEKEMDMVVAIHNNMNERTWKEILEWEAMDGSGLQTPEKLAETGQEPRLLRFQGRPDDLTPMAYARTLLGYKKPFDRHDWVVDRGGKERRYVIDYYHIDETGTSESSDKPPALHDPSAVENIVVDVRPAVDSISDLALRMKMRAFRGFAATKSRNLELFLDDRFKEKPASAEPRTTTVVKQEAIPSGVAQDVPEGALGLVGLANKYCSAQIQASQDCKNDEECGKASVALTYCMATLPGSTCKPVAQAFSEAAAKGGTDLEGAYSAMQICLQNMGTELGKKK